MRKASKKGGPTTQSSSQSQKTPAEMATALVYDERLQSAIEAAIKGILPRIVHKVSTLLGGEGVSKEVAPPAPPSPTAEEGPTAGQRGETDRAL